MKRRRINTAALLLLISLTALPHQSSAAQALPLSRKRPRAATAAGRAERRRALGDLSHILSARTHPHPEPTSAPSAGPSFYDGEMDGGGELPQFMPPPPDGMPEPRNERPWDGEDEDAAELGDSTNSTADTNEMGGRQQEIGNSTTTFGEENKLVPEGGDGTTDLDLLEKLNDDVDDPNNNAKDEGETIDVEFHPHAEPTPAPTAAALPVTDDPTAAPTETPTRRPSPGEFEFEREPLIGSSFLYHTNDLTTFIFSFPT